MPEWSSRPTDVLAVIDIGSNSGRVVVFARDGSRHLRLLAGSRAPLRLVRDVDARGELSEQTMARTTEAVRDFQAIARGAGANQIVAVATAAMRDAANGALFAERLRRELGIRVEIIGGLEEARYGFAGAMRGLTVDDGLLFDLGGGSLQITPFARRRLGKGLTLPLGALRVSERFLEDDPPSEKQVRRLRDHVRSELSRARVPRLAGDARLVGTGGTLRNLAKIDLRMRQYPIATLHGYELSMGRLEKIVAQLVAREERERDHVAGLSAERADSIVGGALTIETLAAFVRARNILVSGRGLREGIALRRLKIAGGSPEAVREAALSSLVARFDGWRADAASRRRSLAATLQRALVPRAPRSLATAIDCAARALDIGRSLDGVNRYTVVARILLSTDLNGFTHHELALTAAVAMRAGDRHADVPSLAVADNMDMSLIDRAAVILALADEIEARCPRGRRISIVCTIGREVTVSVPLLPSWLARDVDERFERVFDRSLIVRH
jgi:exopolyphosphatase / guanosine-5'-triphosphate,3'-diphosphate pyrophosphatase